MYFCVLKYLDLWTLVAEEKECKGDEVQRGTLKTLEDCANACLTVSSMFAYGTNDFTSDAKKQRCYPNGCRCLCETAASKTGACEAVNHLGYRLYKYANIVKGKLHY